MKQNTVRRFLSSLFLTCHVIFWFVCTSFAQVTNTDAVILHFVTMKADNPKVWDEAIARFEQAHPNIKIEREIAPHSSTAYHDLLTQKLKNRDRSMDLFFMDVIWPSEFAAAGWALRLDEYFTSPERSHFLNATIEAGTYQGHVYGVPSRIDSGMLYYRKDLLAKYGFSPPVTWEELVRQAKTILDGERARQPALRGYSGQFKQYEGLVCDMLEFVGSHNSSFLSKDSTRSNLASTETTKAVQFVREQIIQQLATPAVLTYQEPESLAVFVQGKAVFHRNWPYAWGLASDPRHSKIVGNVSVTVLPHFQNGRSVSALGGWLYGISAYSQHPDEAWTFIEFMTSVKMQKYFALHASLAPSRISLYSDPEILQANPQYEDLFPVFQTARPRPRTPVYPMVSHILQRYFSRVLAFPETDIMEEAKEADRQINRFLKLVKEEN
ncbi:ABC transporter substrate-binding protein [Candidatus Nitronereus thalassa]|uniref:ABC transporter substrate-binding protein n=1 Tax=Candidatus Nitronereus thalassa TaxID=3020898 RepID=A0ABU3K3S9_9BACT|nr:ABC transporter substrate-binding protein [Candidatus Nitronereus thalassa]MDT7041030.1 ABC transporter substrate-binding protein [Candidatus Nitronereus thalassa]